MDGEKSKSSETALMLFSSMPVIRELIWIAMMKKRANGKQRDPTFLTTD